ncbi:MAG: hypothetical protein B6245_19070 [Desulfobacteraceae bacterium 4572_88]|nr:MAG: hypothetical protein B6245_19070 [Desulfobacteraceae bacterium 4572_88]
MSNMLMCFAFVLVLVVILFSFRHGNHVLTTVFDRHADRVVENAKLGRELTKIISKANLLTSTFYGRKAFLETKSEKLLTSISDLITQKNTDSRIKKALSKFRERTEKAFEQCERVNHVRWEIRDVRKRFDATLIRLEETLSGRMLDLAAEGQDVSVMKQLIAMISEYREIFLRANFRFARLGLKYFKQPVEKKDHPIFTLLDILHLQIQTLTASEADIAEYAGELLGFVTEYREKVRQFHQEASELQTRLQKMEADTEKLLAIMGEIDGDIVRATSDASSSLKKQISALMAGILLIFLITLPVVLSSFFLNRSISRSLKEMVQGFQSTFEKVVSGSKQVSSASQQVSEGTSEQAASLEETSSSLEQLATMTRQNADNASYAKRIVADSAGDIQSANNSMSELAEFIEDISQASRETQKIIKTIDEIAFQTNLLALNAAVEAARAGEAGAGFAVVADEVRNLAMRSAEAARNTAQIIESTVRKVESGSEMVLISNDVRSGVVGSFHKVSELIGDISGNSNEQAQGIEQLNVGVAEMDKVVQQNAANAEELAATSEEMNAQAEKMNRFAQELVRLVGKGRDQT